MIKYIIVRFVCRPCILIYCCICISDLQILPKIKVGRKDNFILKIHLGLIQSKQLNLQNNYLVLLCYQFSFYLC